MSRSAFRLLIALIGVAVLSIAGSGQCATCGDDVWASQPPFETHQRYINPYTLGLEAGEVAPVIDGLSYAACNTLVVTINRTVNEEYIPLVASWADVQGLQVAIVASSLSGATLARIEQAIADSSIVLITEPASIVLCASFLVGERMSPITFLVDRTGTIVFRRRGFATSTAYERDTIVRAFAATGEVTDLSAHQYVLWYSDVAPWPEFPVEDLAGDPVMLSEGVPRLIYSGSMTGNSAGAFDLLTGLSDTYPEVEFIWLQRILSEDGVRAIWEYAHAFGLVHEHPDVYDVPVEEFLATHDADAARAEFVEDASAAVDQGWTVLLDIDGILARFWTLCVLPSVFIIDTDGTVFFPCSQFPINLMSGEAVVHPQAIPELARILDEMLGR